MKILFLTPQYPYPPHKGTTIRNFNLIAGLAARHEIDLLTFAELESIGDGSIGEESIGEGSIGEGSIGDGSIGDGSRLLQVCRRVEAVQAPTRTMLRRAVETLLRPQPDMALRLWSRRFADGLAAWLRERAYDVIQVEGIEMARYGLLSRRLAPSARLVFDDHNAEWLLQQRTYLAERRLRGWSIGAIYSLIQTWKLRRFERTVCRAADRVVAVSQADAGAIRQLDPGLSVTVVTNGVDTARYRPGIVAPIESGHPAMVFSGTMDFRPNVDAALWFADYVLPKVRAAVPDAVFVIVGQRPHPRLNVLRGRDGIHITGAVEDVRPYLAGASIYVVPLRMGGGTRLKVLEAMAMGAPIVSTSMGVDGFEVTHAHEALIADAPDSFAAEVVKAVDDADLRLSLRANARRFVESRYDWRAIVPKMEKVYE
jgi:glycosyltransferase involved in cell wall biosynthesis